MVELPPKAVSISHPRPSDLWEQPNKRPRPNPKPSNGPKKGDKEVKMEIYLIKGEYVQKPCREFGYIPIHGVKNPDPWSKRKIKSGNVRKCDKKGGKSKNHT